MNTLRGRRGFTLVELMLAIGLASLVLSALASLSMLLIHQQTKAVRALHTQGEAGLGRRGLTLALREASEVYEPEDTTLGSASDVLSLCSNYDGAGGPGRYGLLDPSRGNTATVFCVADGRLYRHTEHGDATMPVRCPMPVPRCGSDGAVLVANAVVKRPGRSSFFARPAGTRGLIEFHYQIGEGSSLRAVDEVVAFQAAAFPPEGSP